MKMYGKIDNYNGSYGNIIGDDGIKYILIDKDLIDDYNPSEYINQKVEFESDYVKNDEYDTYIARFVKIIK